MTQKTPRTPHDAFFTYTFTEMNQAASFFAGVLPEALVQLLDWSTLRDAGERSSSKELNHRFTDLRYTVDTADSGEPVCVNLILEHQSSPNSQMAWRLLDYQYRAITRYRRDNPGTTQVPPVLTVVLYHGAPKWNHPVRLRSYFAGSQQLLTRNLHQKPVVRPTSQLHRAFARKRAG